MKITIKDQIIETEEVQYTKLCIDSLQTALEIFFKGGGNTLINFDSKKELDEAISKLQNPTKQLLQG